jgi:protein-disulfide isomerase
MVRKVVDGFAILIVVWALIVLGRIALEKATSASTESLGSSDAGAQEWFYRFAETGHWSGPKEAPVIVLVFSNYLCGHCVHFSETLQALRERYPQHLAVVFKYFVPPEAAFDQQIPLGAECAGEQGRFWQYHEAAFEAGARANYSDSWRALATSVHVPDLREFEVCVRGARHENVLVRDYREGVSVGVKGTPTFFINGNGPYVGDTPLVRLDSLVTARFPQRGSQPH